MKFLITFCNQKNTTNLNNLLLVDTFTNSKKIIDIQIYNSGFTGITTDKENIYFTYQGEPSGIITLSKKTLKIKDRVLINDLKDSHSILAIPGDGIYAVSTGNDTVYKFKFDKKGLIDITPEIIWRPRGSKGKEDTHHVNSISYWNGELYVTAFGLKEGDSWRTTKNGYVHNISKDKQVINGIYHPHSLKIIDGDFYYIESTSCTLKKNEETVYKLDKGYARGFDMKGRSILFGTGTGRKTSKSTGEKIQKEKQLNLDEVCDIFVLKKGLFSKEYKVNKIFSYFPDYQEIYDIHIL